MTTLLATVDDFSAHRGETPPLLEDHEAVMRAKLALEIASDAVRRYTGRVFDLVEDTVTLDGTGTASLVLPNPPIVEVAEVVTLDSLGVETVVDVEDYRLDPTAGILRRIDGGCWPRGYRNIEVELTSGWLLPGETEDTLEVQPLPMDLQGVVLSMASRVYELGVSVASGVGELKSVTMGVYSETYQDSSSGSVNASSGLTSQEELTLEQWRLVRVA